jgi:hypothetical protein
MKKVFIILVSLFAMMAASTGLKAQEVTILLRPGWNWIGYPYAESIDLEVAFGDFVPMNDDVIQSFWGYSEYATGFGWFGGIDELRPGWGYMYYSNRTEPVNIVLGTPIDLPIVTTSSATNITTYGLTCGGEVTDSGNSGVLVRGVCWSTQQNPTINDPHTTDGYGLGNFTSAVEGLEMNTTYYVRAYAMTTSGTGYGEQIMLSTKNGVPTLTTSAASEIGTTWATCGGDISDDGGMEITERGICWSTTSNPTIEGDHGSNGAGLGSFTVNMNNLEANTTYYVRAYATNSYTTAYGNEVSFRTEVAQTWQNGILPGQFSVSATHQVQFSQGNLQYQASTDSWRFASDQWEYVGADNSNISATYDGYIDLFGWGTSGWDNGNIYYHPYDYEYLTDWNASDFGYGYGPTDGTNYNYSLTGDYANADWGIYNAILNGGNQPNQWRTLTNSEWSYVFNTRTTTSGIRYAKAQVYGVNGIVLVPDDWNSSIYTLNYTNRTDAPFSTNVIADADWATMETNGAVFLPAAGDRNGTTVNGAGASGYYWTASRGNIDDAHNFGFYNGYFSTSWVFDRNYGLSVRLVSVTLPEVSTGTVNDVSGRSAIVSCNVIEDGNADLSACGICCSTSSNPTIDDIVALAQNTTVGEFTVMLNGLTPNTTFYARAFATNSAGTIYGNEISFTTLNIPTWTNGILPGGFSVSANQQVQFSQGNLQYIGSATTPYWQFAENQWDYLGTTTGQNSSNANVDRDLFGWGTSGYNHGAVCYQPWSTSSNYNSDYYAYGSSTYNLNDSTGMADWGYNAISNGGNQENLWRTMTRNEWNYLFNIRSTTSGIRYAKAQVFGVNGIILLPDDWNTVTYGLNNTNNSGVSFSSNVITASQWSTLEQAGAVFLPAAGNRSGISVTIGYYWSATHLYSHNAYVVYFSDSNLTTSDGNLRSDGKSVRLVRSIPVYSIEATPNPAEGGTVTGQGNYNSDATCTLTATPNAGYVFNNWTENGTVVSTDASYSFTVTSDRTLVANFMQVPTGAIAGLFTVNTNGSKVYFSQGNLQYIGSATIPYWKFADNQWDYLGTTTGQNSSNSEVDRDLFGWGTSGYNHGAVCYRPWSTSTNNSDYYAYGNYSYDLGDLTGKADWGYNPISNGGNTPNTWRTLTNAEWVYLFNTRNTDSGVRYVKAKVNNVNGLILLPDNWNTAYHSLNNVNPTGNCDFDSNIISYSDWISDFQPHGAVFLPAGGYRNGTAVSSGFDGNYWSASSLDNQFAGHAGFNNGGVYFGGGNDRRCGFSVRLVCNAE